MGIKNSFILIDGFKNKEDKTLNLSRIFENNTVSAS